MLDVINVSCWSLAYVLVLYIHVCFCSEKTIGIPFLAVSTNFAWETNALILSEGFWGHVLWFALDFGIALSLLPKLHRMSGRNVRFVCLYIAISVLLCQVFWDIFNLREGMLISSFVINLWMSLLFIVARKSISPRFKRSVAVVKMLGTLAATIYYGSFSSVVLALGIVIFLIDLFYFAVCLEEKAFYRKARR